MVIMRFLGESHSSYYLGLLLCGRNHCLFRQRGLVPYPYAGRCVWFRKDCRIVLSDPVEMACTAPHELARQKDPVILERTYDTYNEQ